MNDIGENLRRNRLLCNLSLQEVGNVLNMSAPAVAKYEKGEIKPNSEKLIEFSKLYHVKNSELLKTYPNVQIKFDSFRKKKRLVGQNLELLKNMIQTEVSKYLEVIELNNSFINKYRIKQYPCSSLLEAENIAEIFRKEIINISDQLPISDLINILENIGISIVYIKNNNKFKGFDGFSATINNIPFIVLLEEEVDGARQRFTLAHELGHLILDVSECLVDEEKLCNRFASALLLPKNAMINEFGEKRSNINFYELLAIKEEYKVSSQAIAYRLKDLAIISEYTYRNLCIYMSKNIGSVDQNPLEPEISNQLKKTVCKLESSDIISVQKAADLIGVTINEYNETYNNNRY